MLTIILAVLTILGDIGFGYMAWRLAKKGVTTLSDHGQRISILEHVSLTHEQRIKALEERCSQS